MGGERVLRWGRGGGRGERGWGLGGMEREG